MKRRHVSRNPSGHTDEEPTDGHMGTIFKRRREAEAAANQAIGAALERARRPRGPHASAIFGASLRAQLAEIGEAVEAKIGKPAYGIAGSEQVLMVSPELITAIRQHQMSDVLEGAFNLLFTTRTTKKELIKQWPAAISSSYNQANDVVILRRKALLLANYALQHYDMPIDAVNEVARRSGGGENKIDPLQVDEELESELQLETAAIWYRLIDETANDCIQQQRQLFSEFVSDSLAELLGLQGVAADHITERVNERLIEYDQYKRWFDDDSPESSLLIQFALRALAPIGGEMNVSNITAYVDLLFAAFTG